jgi:electron transport complex protein RnfE
MIKEFLKGLWEKNPVFVLALGLCPTLAVTTSVKNAIGMGLSTIFVLTFSNIIISCIKGVIPAKIRIPCYIIVIAFLVTVVDLVLAGYFPEISSAIGLFIKLIVVNCIILGRAEAYASKNNVVRSTLDGLGMGLGFLIALVIIAACREVLGANKFFGYEVFSGWRPISIMVLPAGAFITMGVILGIFNMRKGSR